jgi:formyl-CoA transferase
MDRAEMAFRQKTTAEWLSLMEEQGIPAGPVRFIEELFDDPQVRANDLVVEVEHQAAGKVKMMGSLAQFSDTPLPTVPASPALGQHVAEILQGLGYSDEKIASWRGAGIVG